LDSLTKQARNREIEQAKVDRLRASLAVKESERNTVEERVNQTEQSGRKKRGAPTFANSDCGKGKGAASLGKGQRHLQKKMG